MVEKKAGEETLEEMALEEGIDLDEEINPELMEEMEALSDEELDELIAELDESTDEKTEDSDEDDAVNEDTEDDDEDDEDAVNEDSDEDDENELDEKTTKAQRMKAAKVMRMKRKKGSFKKQEKRKATKLARKPMTAKRKASAKKKKKSMKLIKSNVEVDVKEHIDALIAGETLTEEFQSKAATIFEAAITSSITSITEDLEKQYEDQMTELQESYDEYVEGELEAEKEEITEDLTEKVSDYLDYIVEQWVEDNAIAIDQGIRTEISESFISDLKSVFENHNIELPEEKVDVLEEYATKVETLEGQLTEEIERNIAMKKEIGKSEKERILESVCKTLADTEKDKMNFLAEGIKFETSEDFEKQMTTLKETYFPKTKAEKPAETLNEEVEVETSDTQLSESMEAYSAALSRSFSE